MLMGRRPGITATLKRLANQNLFTRENSRHPAKEGTILAALLGGCAKSAAATDLLLLRIASVIQDARGATFNLMAGLFTVRADIVTSLSVGLYLKTH